MYVWKWKWKWRWKWKWNGMDDHLHPFVDKDEPITLLYSNSIQSNPIQFIHFFTFNLHSLSLPILSLFNSMYIPLKYLPHKYLSLAFFLHLHQTMVLINIHARDWIGANIASIIVHR